MKILGVDPGLRVTGYAVISCGDGEAKGRRMDLVEAGVIRTKPKAGIADRLNQIYQGLCDVVDELKPHVLVIEKLYAHYKHPATAILMGHARGAVCLVSGVKKISLVSVASTRVKKVVTGSGHASKHQIQSMVQHMLNLKSFPEPPDVADAMAVAISYASQKKAL